MNYSRVGDFIGPDDEQDALTMPMFVRLANISKNENYGTNLPFPSLLTSDILAKEPQSFPKVSKELCPNCGRKFQCLTQ